jgi:pyruvate kinase
MISLRRLLLLRSEVAVFSKRQLARPNLPSTTRSTALCRQQHDRSFSSRVITKPTAWNTKIVCTLGPASSSEQRLEEMIQAGMDVVRLNFSHGAHEKHQETFELVRRLSARYDQQVAILCDIQGPKIRTGKMKEHFLINVGDVIRVTPESILGTPQRIQVKYKTLLEDLDTDDIIFINDGNVKLVVMEKEISSKDLICKCMAAGTISDNKGCNMVRGRSRLA